MGIFHSRQNADVEEADIGANNAYKYPPRSGNIYFDLGIQFFTFININKKTILCELTFDISVYSVHLVIKI